MREIWSASISQIKEALAKKDWSSEEVTKAYLSRIESCNGEINAMLTLNERSVEMAKVVDKKIAQGKELLPLEGIPVAIKDMLCTKGLRTTASSKMLRNFIPPYSATVVERLEGVGSIVIGKTNQDEFGMGSSNEFSDWGPCLNPWNVEYVPGGSSGGSAAAVSSGMVSFSIGTDTGGSIRQPSHCCGVVGVKPTYGRVSRYGVIAFASSLDQVGPITRTVEDAALVLEQICGYDPNDTTSSSQPVPQWSKNLKSDLSGYKVGLPKEYFDCDLDPDVEKKMNECIDMVKAAGADIVEISIPNFKYAISVYYLVATSEASSNLARYDGVRFGYRTDSSSQPLKDIEDFYSRNRGEGFGFEVKRRILLGTFALSSGYSDAYYEKACQVRNLLCHDFLKAFTKCDVILSPVMATPAFKCGESVDNPLKMYLNDMLTITANLVGLPGMSLPVGVSRQGLPIGVQLMGPHFGEQKMLNVALGIESQACFEIKEKPNYAI